MKTAAMLVYQTNHLSFVPINLHGYWSRECTCIYSIRLVGYNHRLQKVQNAAARVTFPITKFDHVTPTLIDLHWLPVTFRIQFKLLLLVYKSLHNQSQTYITDLLSVKPAANYALRSSAKSHLIVPKVNCSTLGDRAFAHAAPVLWNSLPLTIRTSSSLAIFTKQLKLFLFTKAVNLLE